jgi:hypothetical protein
MRLDPASESPIEQDLWDAECAEGDIVCTVFKKLVDFVRYLLIPDFSQVSSIVDDAKSRLYTKTPFAQLLTVTQLDFTAPSSVEDTLPFHHITLYVDGSEQVYTTNFPTVVVDTMTNVREAMGFACYVFLIVYLFIRLRGLWEG